MSVRTRALPPAPRAGRGAISLGASIPAHSSVPRHLPKIDARHRLVAVPATNSMKHEWGRLPKPPSPPKPQPKPKKPKRATPPPLEPEIPPPPIPRRPLYDRLTEILSKERFNDSKSIDAELKLIALRDDPAEMLQMTKSQLEELTRLALEAETYQSTLLAASTVEQMCEDQATTLQPLMNDSFLRFLLAKLKEQRNWNRLLDMDGEYLMTNTWETDLLLQAYGLIIDRAFASWLVRCRARPVNEIEDDAARDQDLYDGWMDFWPAFFRLLDRYSLTLATHVGLESFSTRGMTEDARLRFLDDLLRFCNQLHETDEHELRQRAVACFDTYRTRLADAVTACVKSDYEGESGGASSDAHFDETLTALTSKCLQCGPKLLAPKSIDNQQQQNGEGSSSMVVMDLKAVNVDNVSWRTEAVVLKGLFTAYETVKDYQQHPMDPVVRPNITDMIEKILFQVTHSCIGESYCTCYSRCGDPSLIESCELFVCDSVADRYAPDFAPHIDNFVSHYRGVPNDRWMRALLTVYPSAKREVTKYFSMFAEMENDGQRLDSFHDWRPIALALMVKVSSDNAKLFDAKLIKSIEAIYFSKKPILSVRALNILRNVAANHPRAMLGCGKYYYAAAVELPELDVPPMPVVNEILRNVGLQSEEEAERVIALMENQIRHCQDKPFIEDVLRQWHYLAIVYHEPVEARRGLIDEYRQDPLLCKAAYEVFALATGQQTKATACSVM